MRIYKYKFALKIIGKRKLGTHMEIRDARAASTECRVVLSGGRCGRGEKRPGSSWGSHHPPGGSTKQIVATSFPLQHNFEHSQLDTAVPGCITFWANLLG